jgi:hypothetical protein
MSRDRESVLDERIMVLSTALNVQRRTLSARFAHPSDEPRFPRSVTMRILMRRPALLTRLLPMLATTRRLGILVSLVAIAGIAQVLYRTDPRNAGD